MAVGPGNRDQPAVMEWHRGVDLEAVLIQTAAAKIPIPAHEPMVSAA